VAWAWLAGVACAPSSEPTRASPDQAPKDHPASAPSSAPASNPNDPHAHHDMGGMKADAPLSGRSVFQLEGAWNDQEGQGFTLSQLRGKPTVVVMFYGTCLHVCPILVRDAQRVEEALTPDERAKLQVLLVTVDPARDSPEQLKKYALDKGLDPTRWHLLRGDEAQTRELAAVLGVKYRLHTNGDISHSNLVTLLNAEGEVAHQTEGLRQPVEPMVGALRGLKAP
jgi:protein SCO1/2